jgi:Ribbon-helix-helix protein, copG family
MFMAKENINDTDARVTIRVDPEYREAMQRAAAELGINQSILVRNAVQEYVERNQKHFSAPLFRFFRIWREDRSRMNML